MCRSKGKASTRSGLGSEEAIRHFRWLLERVPERSGVWLRALWLYNIAHMTLDEYPEGVAEAWRLPTEVFAAAVDFPEFPNVAQDRGLDTFSLSGGVVADDFDNDGDTDLMVSSMETNQRGQLRLFLNDGAAHFVERTEEAGLLGLLGGLNLIHADFNEDGWVDVYVLRGGWFQRGGRHPNSLLMNNGDGAFTDVAFVAGVAGKAPTQTADWADYDGDGDLDLYVGNEQMDSLTAPCELFRNDGDGSFTDVAEAAGGAERTVHQGGRLGRLRRGRTPRHLRLEFWPAQPTLPQRGRRPFCRCR